jgi:stage II sporulation SpoAA-like protein
MYHILSESENGYIGIKIQRKLTQEDYELLISYLHQLRNEVGLFRLLCDMTECEGLDSQGLWEEIESQLYEFREIPRVAVVGDGHWMKCGTKAFYPLLKTTVQYFTPNQLDEAWKWVKASEA